MSASSSSSAHQLDVEPYTYPEPTNLDDLEIPYIPGKAPMEMAVRILRYYLDNYSTPDQAFTWMTENRISYPNRKGRFWDIVAEWNIKHDMIRDMRGYDDDFPDTYIQLKVSKDDPNDPTFSLYRLIIEPVSRAIEIGVSEFTILPGEIDELLELFISTKRVYDVRGNNILLKV